MKSVRVTPATTCPAGGTIESQFPSPTISAHAEGSQGGARGDGLEDVGAASGLRPLGHERAHDDRRRERLR